ncbi:MAG: isoprenylcysteine carboxylmethyltransferase family protein [Pseudonocardiales bacterium]
MDRRKLRAAVGSTVFFFAAPCVVAGVLPWWISGWSPEPVHSTLAWLRVAAGGAVVVGCAVVLLRAFVRFVDEGIGTPAPAAPTERLVVGGDYRYVRNPMYVAVVGCIAGQALLLGSAALLVYTVAAWLGMASFVRWYEEPLLLSRFGEEYQAYRAAVPAWRPRLRPWNAPKPE